MIYLITGASHTGKTYLAQKLLEKTKISAFSQDHLKMGLIRTGLINVTVYDDDKITELIWPITREMIKTAIENHQNLIVEGCYIPETWRNDFDEDMIKEIRYVCLLMSEQYIRNHSKDIEFHGDVIENRLDKSININELINDNNLRLEKCRENKLPYILIDQKYDVMKQVFQLFDLE